MAAGTLININNSVGVTRYSIYATVRTVSNINGF